MFHTTEYIFELLGTALLIFLSFTGVYVSNLLGMPALLQYVTVGLFAAAAILIVIYSFLGKRSGGHINPSVTIAFWMDGFLEKMDAIFYILSQLVGGVIGAWVAYALYRGTARNNMLSFPTVDYPVGVVWVLEFVITLLLITVVFTFSRSTKWGPYTGWGVAIYAFLITVVFASVSDLSLNPAVSFGTAVLFALWGPLVIYSTAAVVGTVAAVYFLRSEAAKPICPKMCHKTREECLFTCTCEYKSELPRSMRSNA
ncbi:MAG: aquaporin family protein [Candidatus Omnitrophica bacterium]|nr:aquaporin family protein [Candidatus Omnitrophota bacterium]